MTKPIFGGPKPASPVHQTDSYIDSHKDRFLNELLDLLRIPSVSADPKYKADVARCAEAVKQRMIEAGLEKVEVCPTKGHPIVYGERIVDPAKPTVLVYGHYDVQPPDPLDLWQYSLSWRVRKPPPTKCQVQLGTHCPVSCPGLGTNSL